MTYVLVVDDDPVIRTSLVEALSALGHVVSSAADGFGALREFTQCPPDVVVLDLGLPDLDGADALLMIRGLSRVPVLVATARDDEREIIRLLDAGADDYLVKPFSGAQLAARISAVLRRCSPDAPAAVGPATRGAAGTSRAPAVPRSPRAPSPSRPVLPGTAAMSLALEMRAGPPVAAVAREGGLEHSGGGALLVGELRIDPLARTVHLAGEEIRLTRREFDLLAFLARHAGLVVSRKQILAEVWRQPYVDEQTVDVHLSCLRRKLGERAARPRYLHTVHGVGVKLVSPS
ncbi:MULTISPECIES: response regulator transcription factor [unclassified Kitasatospora]|uniref:response regulator transcription factor n=1 Tax=unclassified Kitasatospora TaxID=2633591 RepID=UPI0033DED4C8